MTPRFCYQIHQLSTTWKTTYRYWNASTFLYRF